MTFRLSPNTRLKKTFISHVFRYLSWPMLIVLLSATTSLVADEIKEAKQQLENIAEQIQTLRKEEQSQNGQLGETQAKVESIDKQLNGQLQKISALQEDQDNAVAKLSTLRDQRQTLQAKLDQQSQLSSEHIRSLYRLQRQPNWLLAKESIAERQRSLSYWRYIQQSRKQVMRTIQTDNEALAVLTQNQQDALNTLADVQANLVGQQQTLTSQKDEQERLSLALKKSLESTGNQLQNLQDEKKQLESLLDKLREASLKSPFPTEDAPNFSQLQGKLSWPVSGKVSRVPDRGVFIDSGSGKQVLAVSAGRVVFADWFKGLGLLIIIDHGDGYMSLYGNNETVYKKIGDWVDTSAVIATTGKSGGQRQPGLYFEIRRNAQTLDPKKWVKA